MRFSILLALLMPLAGIAGAPPDKDVTQELKRFQGAWEAISIQQGDGQKAPAEVVKDTRLVVEGNKFTLTGKDYTLEGTFTIDPARSPKAIDVILKDKDGKETRILGIYQIQGDVRKSCFSGSEKERPTEFKSEKGYFGFEWKPRK